MKEIALSLVAGAVAGGFFATIKLPVPAPPSVAGVMGIVGLAVGYAAVRTIWAK